jgi:transcriptional regulator with XRE-family HTH domain
MDYKIMGSRIRELREEAGMSQPELAAKLYTYRGNICYAERGRRALPIDLLVALADLFDVSLDYLCGRAGGRLQANTRCSSYNTQLGIAHGSFVTDEEDLPKEKK